MSTHHDNHSPNTSLSDKYPRSERVFRSPILLKFGASFSRPFMISIVAKADHIGVASQNDIDMNAPDGVEMLVYPFTWDRSVGPMCHRLFSAG